VACPKPSDPDDNDGESADVVPLLSELDVDELDPLLVDVEAACAATPTAIVPARLAATSAPVIVAVRARPRSRSMGSSSDSKLRQRRSWPGSLAPPCAGPEPPL
jgi:hypothetical protein